MTSTAFHAYMGQVAQGTADFTQAPSAGAGFLKSIPESERRVALTYRVKENMNWAAQVTFLRVALGPADEPLLYDWIQESGILKDMATLENHGTWFFTESAPLVKFFTHLPWWYRLTWADLCTLVAVANDDVLPELLPHLPSSIADLPSRDEYALGARVLETRFGRSGSQKRFQVLEDLHFTVFQQGQQEQQDTLLPFLFQAMFPNDQPDQLANWLSNEADRRSGSWWFTRQPSRFLPYVSQHFQEQMSQMSTLQVEKGKLTNTIEMFNRNLTAQTVLMTNQSSELKRDNKFLSAQISSVKEELVVEKAHVGALKTRLGDCKNDKESLSRNARSHKTQLLQDHREESELQSKKLQVLEEDIRQLSEEKQQLTAMVTRSDERYANLQRETKLRLARVGNKTENTNRGKCESSIVWDRVVAATGPTGNSSVTMASSVNSDAIDLLATNPTPVLDAWGLSMIGACAVALGLYVKRVLTANSVLKRTGPCAGKEDMARDWIQDQENLDAAILICLHEELVDRLGGVAALELTGRLLMVAQFIEGQHEISFQQVIQVDEAQESEQHQVIFDSFQGTNDLIVEEDQTFKRLQHQAVETHESIFRRVHENVLGECCLLGAEELTQRECTLFEEKLIFNGTLEIHHTLRDQMLQRTFTTEDEDAFYQKEHADLMQKVDPTGFGKMVRKKFELQEDRHQQQLEILKHRLAVLEATNTPLPTETAIPEDEENEGGETETTTMTTTTMKSSSQSGSSGGGKSGSLLSDSKTSTTDSSDVAALNMTEMMEEMDH